MFLPSRGLPILAQQHGGCIVHVVAPVVATEQARVRVEAIPRWAMDRVLRTEDVLDFVNAARLWRRKWLFRDEDVGGNIPRRGGAFTGILRNGLVCVLHRKRILNQVFHVPMKRGSHGTRTRVDAPALIF